MDIFNLTIRLNDSRSDGSIVCSGCPISVTGGSVMMGNSSSADSELPDDESKHKFYWALLLVVLPVLAIFGNILVIVSVYREKSLQSLTNYFIVSLAFADLLVGGVVMPFALYFLVNVDWELSETICDFWIAFDVTLSTASILNLVAISIDRFMAVTRPIKYATYKNNNRVKWTIASVWLISVAIGSPIVLGLNTSPERTPELCIFYNSDFIIYSSLGSFYIPCFLMVVLYYKIFKAIRERAKKKIGTAAEKDRSAAGEEHAVVLENVAQTKRHAIPAISNSAIPITSIETPVTGEEATAEQLVLRTDQPDEEQAVGRGDDDYESDVQAVECHVIRNEGADESCVSVSETECRVIGSQDGSRDPVHGKADQGMEVTGMSTATNDFAVQEKRLDRIDRTQDKKHQHVIPGVRTDSSSFENSTSRVASAANLRTQQPSPAVPTIVPRKNKRLLNFRFRRPAPGPRTNVREKTSARLERKATKTLAIVLGVFLISWTPFFTSNIIDAICIKMEKPDCRVSTTTFMLTTWLGYMNSIVNPVIYTIFNPEFRKAFKKILCLL